MKAIKKIFILFFISTTYSKPQYNDFLVGTSCITNSHEKGVCKYYKNCPHLVQKVNSRQMHPADVFKCNTAGVICCTPDVPATTTLSPSAIISDDLLKSRSDKTGRISEESKSFFLNSTKF